MNSRYVFFTSAPPDASLQLVGNSIICDMGISPNRPPYEIIELIEASVITDAPVLQIVVKADIQPSNYYSNDHTKVALGFVQFRNEYTDGVDTFYRYTLNDFEKPRYQVSNLRKFLLSLTILNGTELPYANIHGFKFIFKISYPEQGSITRDYVKAIPNPL
jgi:hypothetical protein